MIVDIILSRNHQNSEKGCCWLLLILSIMSLSTLSCTSPAYMSFFTYFILPSDYSTFKSSSFPYEKMKSLGVVVGGVNIGLSLNMLYLLIFREVKQPGSSIWYL
jgi:hypothetical protein